MTEASRLLRRLNVGERDCACLKCKEEADVRVCHLFPGTTRFYTMSFPGARRTRYRYQWCRRSSDAPREVTEYSAKATQVNFTPQESFSFRHLIDLSIKIGERSMSGNSHSMLMNAACSMLSYKYKVGFRGRVGASPPHDPALYPS
jgi:hypothetical protein